MIEEYVGSIAGLIGSLTVVGSALLWIYNKFIGSPREKRRIKEENLRQRRMIEVVTKENEPLNSSIKQLTDWLNESKLDRENLNRMVKENRKYIEDHEERIDDHNNRLITLEAIKKFAHSGGE